MLTLTDVVVSGILFGTAFYLWSIRRSTEDNPNGLPFPPGPPTLPVTGNLLDVGDDAPWLDYSTLSAKYGDIMHLKIMNLHVVVLSSMEIIADLFEKRGAIYSDRYQSTMLTELMDMKTAVDLTNNNDRLRRYRTIFQQHYSPAALRKYDEVQFEITRVLLKRLKSSPGRFYDHTRFFFASLIMTITYGVHIEDESNEYLIQAEEWQYGFNQAAQPGRFWVDYLPFLKYVPAWLPGAQFQRLAAGWRQNMYNARDLPYNFAKASMEEGSAQPSVVTSILDTLGNTHIEEKQDLEIRWALATAFGAGVDTNSPTLHVFFYAMLTHPEFQKRAQAELDRVVGSSRLPTLEDRPNLPYIEAVLKEVLRWEPVTPFALPHTAASNDEYRGYYIPKGAVVFGNAWHILHDPVEYPCPEQFRPHRFLNDDGTMNKDILDPSVVAFGIGRRICPGRFLSSNSLFISMSSILHTFDIVPALDADGKPIKAEFCLKPGMICMPEPFPCSLKVRSPAADALISE